MSKQSTYDKIDLLGVEIDAISNQEAIDYCIGRAAARQPSCYVVKPYVEFLDRAAHNEKLQDLLNAAELALPDGIALTWAAAYLYAGKRSWLRFWITLFQIVLSPNDLRWPLPDRTAGVTFTWPLLQAAATTERRVFLIGNPVNDTTGRGIEATAKYISERIPSLVIAGTFSGRDQTMPKGQVSDSWHRQVLEAIHKASPDIILVGMGFPLQEKISARLTSEVHHGVFIGEGGTFDYAQFGGTLRKAPARIQQLGLEWLWRLTLEPKRLKRQFSIPRFIFRIWRSR
ncbi:MAG TPA: WecB/TagA/CpsF family glycosyltransferase [Candidatus Saccharimonadia bacterium]|nr:WecB/TagA/CpsF family glycosyltransferase [Candidatus Saccharimonadia bacterium]